jgi:hypothetical protein
MRLERVLLVAVLWPIAACADPLVSAPVRPGPPVVGFDGFSSSGSSGINAVPGAPIPDAKGNAGPAAIEKTKLLDPPRPPPSPGVMLR